MLKSDLAAKKNMDILFFVIELFLLKYIIVHLMRKD